MEPFYYSKMNKMQQATYHAICQGVLQMEKEIQPKMDAQFRATKTLFVDAVTLFSHEALAAQFEEYSFEFSHNKVFWWVKVRMGRTGLCPTVSGGLLP